MRFQKISLVFLIIAVVISALLIITNAKSVIAGSRQGTTFTEININKGKPAPEFTVENLVGEKISLKDFRKSILVLTFGFSKDTALDIESYRRRIRSDFKGKGIKFLKVVHINKPLLLTKGFILKKMRGVFKDDKDPIIYTAIDWGGSLNLNKKYAIKGKDTPALFIIGREGEILFGFQGWYSDDNLKRLEKGLSAALANPAYRKKKILIGVSRIMFHYSFELTQRGFRAALKEAGYVEGKNTVFDLQDAGAQSEKMVTIANKFINDKVDLIHSLSIMGTQILVKIVKKIPIVYSMVIDPVEDGVVPTLGPSGTNVTGVAVPICSLQDRWPIDPQLEMYIRFIPDAKRWGTIYNPKSANTIFHIKEMRDTCEYLKLQLVEATASTSSQVGKAAESLAGKVDAIYITSDQVPISAFEDIASVCNKNKIPLFAGELGCVSRGAVAAYNQNYFRIGYRAGKKAVRILNGEKAGDIPSELPKKYYLVISLKNAMAQGITIPKEVKKIADTIL